MSGGAVMAVEMRSIVSTAAEGGSSNIDRHSIPESCEQQANNKLPAGCSSLPITYDSFLHSFN